VLVGAESLWPNVIQWKPMFSSNWKNIKSPERGGTNNCLKKKVFLKNQKHQPNIVEITHLCIMHGVQTSSILIIIILILIINLDCDH